MKNMCCDMMRYHTANHCPVHNSPFECPDWLVLYDEDDDTYGIVIHDGGTSCVRIRYCPWCGKALPTGPEDDKPEPAGKADSQANGCCDDMRSWSSDHCTAHPVYCYDRLVLFDEKGGYYGIMIHDGGSSFVKIRYCPWCGKAVPARPEEKEPDNASGEE